MATDPNILGGGQKTLVEIEYVVKMPAEQFVRNANMWNCASGYQMIWLFSKAAS